MYFKRKFNIITVLFLMYAAVMCFLLFGRRVVYGDTGYVEMLMANYSLQPFATIKYYLGILCRDIEYLKSNAVINLVGNVVMFVPLGVFLPMMYSRMKKLLPFLLAVVITITVVELLQFFTLLGFCDIDDLILNVMGALFGYAGYMLCRVIAKRSFKK